jgi:hypothetical protein
MRVKSIETVFQSAKVAGFMPATFAILLLCCAPLLAQPATAPAIQWMVDSNKPGGATVELGGIDAKTLAETPLDVWRSALRVYVGIDHAPDSPAMIGAYDIADGNVRFHPQFPLSDELGYHAVFDSSPLPGNPRGKPTRFASIRMGKPVQRVPSAAVSRIYPTANVLPENLLKFYIHFSAPMNGGRVYDHIHLLDETGKAVELPFLELGEELWDPAMTRLTLFIDPGRIKRGVTPLEEIGPSLQTGKRFTLVIDKGWHDANGVEMKEPFRKEFSVVDPDREPPNPNAWKIIPPASGTKQPLRVEFGEPMDFALMSRMISVIDSAGAIVRGAIDIEKEEKSIRFTPEAIWRKSEYHLRVLSTIEDLSGNNIGKPFDVDLNSPPRAIADPEKVELPFDVN